MDPYTALWNVTLQSGCSRIYVGLHGVDREMATRMKDIDLKHKIVEYFIDIATTYKTFPQSFTPSIIGNNIGAYIPRIGSVADAVVVELQGRGIDIEYKKEGNKRSFVVHGHNP